LTWILYYLCMGLLFTFWLGCIYVYVSDYWWNKLSKFCQMHYMFRGCMQACPTKELVNCFVWNVIDGLYLIAFECMYEYYVILWLAISHNWVNCVKLICKILTWKQGLVNGYGLVLQRVPAIIFSVIPLNFFINTVLMALIWNMYYEYGLAITHWLDLSSDMVIIW